ncbi:UNVERIFIED_CONTAM: hypothetical protein GTU68_024786 [Idotea baltica]|nr:hypothetical protein [Idotea baltica]
MKQSKILVVDDEADIRDLLSYNLAKSGYTVIEGENGEEAVKLTPEEQPDLVIMDVMMPHMDGIEACQKIRANRRDFQPIILFLTARSEGFAEQAAFEAGANDYIIKPVRIRALIARIQALFRNSFVEETNYIYLQDLEIDKEAYILRKAGNLINLTRREFELIAYLATRPGKLFRRDDLLDGVWGNQFVSDRTIDVHVSKLREKIGHKYIKTIKGVGYKLVN